MIRIALAVAAIGLAQPLIAQDAATPVVAQADTTPPATAKTTEDDAAKKAAVIAGAVAAGIAIFHALKTRHAKAAPVASTASPPTTVQ